VVTFSHQPVLLRETIDGLAIKPNGTYVDGTLGGGGHSYAILQRLNDGGQLIGIDRDEDALRAATERLHPFGERFHAVHGNFHDITNLIPGLADGIVLDLGVSSYQLDTPERGFSYRFDGPLDMRMDQGQSKNAYTLVNLLSEKELVDIIFAYGEDRYARRIARNIVMARQNKPIETTGMLADIIECAVPRTHKPGPHPAMRTFQALRIAVNDELAPLDAAIRAAVSCLHPGGRLCVITFHSLEDRIVKQVMNYLASDCHCPRDFPVCVCRTKPAVRIISRKPICPSEAEITENSRAHSAKLRIAEKLP